MSRKVRIVKETNISQGELDDEKYGRWKIDRNLRHQSKSCPGLS
mgnify:CR=1 FL=1